MSDTQARRHIVIDDAAYHIGSLVLANLGRAGDLLLPRGQSAPLPQAHPTPERGSVIIVIGTDLPLYCRQLRRIVRRTGVGVARVGSFWGHGSGDLAIGLTTAGRISHGETRAVVVGTRRLNERKIDLLFRAVSDITQESVLDALVSSRSLRGWEGHHRVSIAEVLRA